MPLTAIPRYGPPVASYTIKVGDTLSKIALAKMGDLNLWRELAAYNGILDPNQIRIGQVIYIPNVKVIRAIQQPTVKPIYSEIDEISVGAKRLPDVILPMDTSLKAGLPAWWPFAAIGLFLMFMGRGGQR